MAHYYRGEVAHRRFPRRRSACPTTSWSPTSTPSACSRCQAYDRWKESLGFKQAYWATASGYQMSQIFVELWEAHRQGAVPAADRRARRAPTYVAEVHDRVREHLEKALEGHRMNVELAEGVRRRHRRGARAASSRPSQIMELLAKDAAGSYVTPTPLTADGTHMMRDRSRDSPLDVLRKSSSIRRALAHGLSRAILLA